MSERYHGLDALRAGAMLLGVVLHATMIYVEPVVAAAFLPELPPIDPAPGTSALALWIHLWRMPLFFVLAGFFAEMVIERRGAGHFLRDRGLRILGTLLVFVALFNWLTAQPLGTLDHLWFLWALWWCGVLSVVARPLGKFVGPLLRAFDSPRAMLWLILPVIVMSLFLREETVRQLIPATLFDPEWRGFLFAYGFFLGGQALWQRRFVVAQLTRPRVFLPWLVAGNLAAACIMVLAFWVPERLQAWASVSWVSLWLTAGLLAAISTLGITIGLIGLAGRVIRRGSAVLTVMVDMAYPIYVFHLYIALGVSVALVAASPERPQIEVVALTSAITLAACVALYVALVRFTPVDWLFAGPRKSWWQWPRTAKGRPVGRPST